MKNLFTVLFSILAFSGIAQDGTKDLTFGINGIAGFGPGNGELLYGMEVLPNGKILFLHTTFGISQATPGVTRLNSDGSVDQSFAANGIFYINAEINSGGSRFGLAVDDQNRPVVLAVSDNETVVNVYRILADGTGFDNSFDTDGVATIDFGISSQNFWGRQVKVRPNGKIVIGGSINGDVAAAQFNSNGSIDSGFGVGGKIVLDFPDSEMSISGMTLQNDGKILLCGKGDLIWGDPMALIRLTALGNLDNTFDSDGVKYRLIGSSNTRGKDVHVLADGTILVGGEAFHTSSEGRGALAAFNEDGSGFGMFAGSDVKTLNHSGNVDFFNEITVQANGKILAMGEYDAYTIGDHPFWVVRFNSDGTLDPTFSDDGLVWEYWSTHDITGQHMALTPQGDIIVGANAIGQAANLAFLKLNNALTVSIVEAGTIDLSVYPNPTTETLTVNLTQLEGNTATITIVDVLGKEVLTSSELTGRNINIDVISLAKGTYFATVISGSETGSFQFVKN